MESFSDFMAGALAWIPTIACLWPLNVPLMAFAFRASYGPKPPDMESGELWTRATLAALFLALITAGFILVAYWLTESMEFPGGMVHLVALMCYLPLGMWLCFVMFALDDLGQGLSVLLIYLLLPIFVLFVLNLMIGFWNPLLNYVYGWLKKQPV